MKNFWSRRDFLFQSGGGIAGVALAALLNQDGLLGAPTASAACDSKPLGFNPYASRPPHFKPRAKSVISLFMSGGVSHVDTFQYKPALAKYNGMLLEGKGEIVVRQGYPGPLMKSPYSFKQYGQSGAWVSEIFPNIASIVDELAFMHSCKGLSNDHVISHYEWQTGSIQMGFPSVGSWITYGLGSENQNLPAFVVFCDQKGGPYAGPPNWQSGFLPAAYQGTPFRSQGDPILDLSAKPSNMTLEEERARLDQLRRRVRLAAGLADQFDRLIESVEDDPEPFQDVDAIADLVQPMSGATADGASSARRPGSSSRGGIRRGAT